MPPVCVRVYILYLVSGDNAIGVIALSYSETWCRVDMLSLSLYRKCFLSACNHTVKHGV